MKARTILSAAGLLALSMSALSAPALAQDNGAEINYPEGALGYNALISGQTDKAIVQLQDYLARNADDPGALINLAAAYERIGETQKAREYYTAAVNCRKSYELILADGKVVESRALARRALRKLDKQVALR